MAVHPHGCGDSPRRDWVNARAVGSPPRVWGQLQFVDICFGLFRFTPTGVGTAIPSTTTVTEFPVHPHGCGDSADRLLSSQLTGGSPPRVWGQRTQVQGLEPVSAVHPHGCGDSAPPHRQAEGLSRFTPTGVGTAA